MTSLVASACLAILGARVFPAPQAPPLEDGAVLICDGKIADVGERSRVFVPADKEADLVLLEGDPRSEIQALARVRYTIRRGAIIWKGE